MFVQQAIGEHRFAQGGIKTTTARVLPLSVTATLAVVRLPVGVTVNVSLAPRFSALVPGALRVMSLAIASEAKPLELNSAMASARRWGARGMTDDLIGNNRAVRYSVRFLQNDVFNYHLKY